MSPTWDRLGQAASVMQVTGVDAFGLVSMIAQAALTARRNRDLCRQLALHVAVVGDLLRGLQIPELRRRPETRRPLDQLDDALLRAYRLVRSCSSEAEETTVMSKLCRLLNGADVASRLRAALEEIDRYVTLIPVVALVATIHTYKHGTEEVHNEEVPQNRPRLTIEEVTEYLSLHDEQPLTVRQPRIQHLVPSRTEPSVPSLESPSIHGTAMASSLGESEAHQEQEEVIIPEVREGSSSGVQAREGPKILVIMRGDERPEFLVMPEEEGPKVAVIMPGDTRPSFLAIPRE